MDTKTGISFVLAGLLAGGLVCLFIAARSAWRTARRVRLGCVADAVVVELVPDGTPGPECAYRSVAEFRDRDGRTQRIKARVAYHPPAHAIGDRIRVSHEPGAEADADFVMDGRGLLVLVLFGAFLATIALLIMWNISTGAFTVT
jgi:hypothetical protein